MSSLRLRKHHHMSHDNLKSEVEALVDKLVEKFGGHYHWEGNAVHYAYAGGVKACVSCTESVVEVDVELSMMMSFLKGKIKSEVETYLDKHII